MQQFPARRGVSSGVVARLVFGLALLGCLPAFGQSPGAGAVTGGKSVNIPRLAADPQIDGRLDEGVWEQAALVSDFHQMNPVEYGVPSQRTEVRLFYSEDALYVGARMYEDDPSLITANILRQGQGLAADDVFNLILDPYLDRRGGYIFEINPNGVRVDGIYQNVSQVDRNWEGIWQARTEVDELGWTAEMRIPFQTLSFDPTKTQWGINFRRAIRRDNEEMGWISRNRLMNPSIAGTAEGLSDLRQGLGLDVVPYLVLRRERRFGANGFEEETVEPQLDVFYKITPQLNAALTLNTDFSATEVDDRVVNLSRFNLFFPERRDFFLRDSDIFEFGRIGTAPLFGQEGNEALPRAALNNGRPFFSRNIGLSPSGAPVDINAGAKLSGRIGNWNVGTLVVSQDEDELTGVDSQSVFVGRAALNVGRESQVGLIATQGDPQSNLDNSLLGADFRYRNSNLPGGRLMEAEGWYQQSDSEGLDGEDAAYGLGISFPNNSGWRGGYSYKRIEDNFNPGLGFVNQRGIRDHALDAGYRHFLRPGGFLRSFYVGADGYRNEDADSNQLITQTLDLRTNVHNQRGDSVNASIIQTRELLTTPFTIWRAADGSRSITLPVGDYRFESASAGIGFGGQRRLSGSASLTWGEYFGGNRVEREGSITWRPTPRFNLDLRYNENEIHLPEGNFTVRLTSVTALVNFSSSLSWSNRLQYDNVSESAGFNSRLRWIPEAGRETYLVLNWGVSDPDRDNRFESVNGDLTLKFNHTFRF